MYSLEKIIGSLAVNSGLRKIIQTMLVITLYCLSLSTRAGEIYKWTDAQGHVHFGDQQQFETAKPATSSKIDLPVVKQKQYTPEEINTRIKMLDDARLKINAEQHPPVSVLDQPKGITVDPSKINPQCETLAKQVMNTPTGQSFKHLADQMNNLCTGLTYECREYRKHPKDNYCHFIKQHGSDAITHKVQTD